MTELGRTYSKGTDSRTVAGTDGDQGRKYEPWPKEESGASQERIIER